MTNRVASVSQHNLVKNIDNVVYDTDDGSLDQVVKLISQLVNR